MFEYESVIFFFPFFSRELDGEERDGRVCIAYIILAFISLTISAYMSAKLISFVYLRIQGT